MMTGQRKPSNSAGGDGRQVNLMLPPEVLIALDAFVAKHDEPTTRTQAARFILTDWLRTHGLLKGDHPEPSGPATDLVDKMDAAIEEHRRRKRP